MFRRLILVGAALLAGLAGEALRAGQPEKSEDHIVQLLPRDAIPAIRNPLLVPAAKAALHDEERVLGVVVEGQSHAYPLIDLDRHEVVDDTVGGRPIAASW